MKKTLFFLSLSLCTFSAIAQVTFSSQSINTNGSSRAAVDMNGDFLDDIVTISTANIQIFYQQPDGSFVEENITTTPADHTPSWSLSVADYDRNGFNDLLYGGGNGVTFMRANNSGTAYTEVSYSEYVFSQRSNFVDINNDGNLDAFVCHDVQPNVYFINDGNGNLEFFQGGIGDIPDGGNYGSVWVDYDNDGDQDLYIAKCNVSGQLNERSEDEMHNNDGSGVFTEVGASAGLEDNMQTWSSAWADYDNDGDMDVFIGSSSGGAPHKLKINNGDGTFTDISASTGINAVTATGIENCTYDFNNDGFADILTNGNLLLNNGDLTFTPQINVLPSNNGSIADLNNDGFLDSFAGNNTFINNGNSNHYITLNTIGVESNINGIGARVEITSALGTQIRDVRSGEGFRYMSTLNTHVGLGEDTEITSIVIKWPSGIVDTLENVPVDQTITIVEGETILGIDDNLVSNLILYPNPTSDILNLGNIDGFDNAQFSIINLAGQKLMSGTLNENSVDVTTLSAGMYFIRISDDNNTIAQRFIKK